MESTKSKMAGSFKLTFLTLFWMTLNVHSQSLPPLFQEVEPPVLAKYSAHSFGKRATTVTLDWRSLAGSRVPGSPAAISEWLNLNLPGNVSIDAKRTRVSWRGSQRFTWSGEAEGNSVTLSVHNGFMSGVIHAAGKVFEIEPINGEFHRITELDMALFEEIENANEKDHDDAGMEPLAFDQSAMDEDTTEIDVMILYDQGTLTRNADIASFLDALVESSNDAYRRSGIPQKIRLVHHQLVTPDGTEASDCLRWLSRDTVVAGLRNSYGADLVALIIETGSGLGIANMNGAFSVTRRSAALGNRTFTHELGHNMGARHDRAQMTEPSGYKYGYINYDKRWRTVMSYSTDCRSCPRINNFSSPLVLHNGDPTGEANTMDNARGLRERAVAVSNFRRTVVPSSNSGFRLVVTRKGKGTIAGNTGSGIDCGASCSANVPAGSVTLTATPASGGWVFRRWTGDCTGTSRTCTVDVTSDRQTVAIFEHPDFFRLSLVNVDTKEEIRALTGKDTLNLAVLPNNFTVEAIPVEDVGSVEFIVDGALSREHVENLPPYTLFSEATNASLPWNPKPVVGEYQLTATAFSERGGGGDELATRAISLSILSTPVVGLQTGMGNNSRELYSLQVIPGGLQLNLSQRETLAISLQSLEGKSTVLAQRAFSPGTHQLNWQPGVRRGGIHILHVEGARGKQVKRVFLLE